MHYNPGSIALARRTVEEAPAEMRAVVVESCVSRWNRTLEASPEGSFSARFVLPSEMRAAATAAGERGIPVVLGDADVGDLGARLGALLRQTFRDLAQPVQGGWRRIFNDLRVGAAATFDTRGLDEFLGLGDALRSPDLVAGALVSTVRYPLAFFLKAPAKAAASAAALACVGSALDSAAATAGALEEAASLAVVVAGDGAAAAAAPTEMMSSLPVEYYALAAALVAYNVLFPIVATRLLFVEMLGERNLRLARSIREAARREKGDVVAVLGALHVNGVAKLLANTPDDAQLIGADGDGKAGFWWPPKDQGGRQTR